MYRIRKLSISEHTFKILFYKNDVYGIYISIYTKLRAIAMEIEA